MTQETIVRRDTPIKRENRFGRVLFFVFLGLPVLAALFLMTDTQFLKMKGSAMDARFGFVLAFSVGLIMLYCLTQLVLHAAALKTLKFVRHPVHSMTFAYGFAFFSLGLIFAALTIYIVVDHDIVIRRNPQLYVVWLFLFVMQVATLLNSRIAYPIVVLFSLALTIYITKPLLLFAYTLAYIRREPLVAFIPVGFYMLLVYVNVALIWQGYRRGWVPVGKRK